MSTLSILASELKKSLDTIIVAVNKKSGMLPILSHIHIEKKEGKISLSATDLTMHAMTSIEVDNEKSDFNICVPAVEFSTFVSKIKNKEEYVNIEIKEGKLDVSQGKRKISVPTMDPVSFPALPEKGNLYVVFEDKEDAMKQFYRMRFFSEEMDVKPILTAINIVNNEGSINLRSTDGYKAAFNTVNSARIEIESNFSISPSGKYMIGALKALRDSGDNSISLYKNEGNMTLVSGSTVVNMRLMDSRQSYPDISRMKPKSFIYSISLSAEELLDSLSLAQTVQNQETKLLKMKITQGVLNIKSGDTRGLYEDDIETDGDVEKELEFGMNSDQLKACCTFMKGAEGRMFIKGNHQHQSFELSHEGIEGYKILLMPNRF